MISLCNFIKTILSYQDIVIENVETGLDSHGELSFFIYVHQHKKASHLCPFCHRKCPGYDTSTEEKLWRDNDLNGLKVYIVAKTIRIKCPEHGVVTENVEWAYHNSGFTKSFDKLSTLLGMNVNKSFAAKYQRCRWESIGASISRVKAELEPDPTARFNNLVNIGVDETSFTKGHNYITTVVNLDSGEVVWAGVGHDEATLSKFFEALTEEQRANIKNIAGDGARWIDACRKKYIPNAVRCIDLFHVVQWAIKALDNIRAERWREARKLLNDLTREFDKVKKDQETVDKRLKAKLEAAKTDAKTIKSAKYALGKNPENLTNNQEAKLDCIADTDPKLYRAYCLKEMLRLALKLTNPTEAEELLKKFYWRATHSRIEEMKQLAYKIKRHFQNIINTITNGFNSAMVEATNSRIKFIFKKACGFRNDENMIDMVMLACSNLKLRLTNRIKDEFSFN